MRLSSRILFALVAIATIFGMVAASGATQAAPAHASSAAGQHFSINCANGSPLCTEVHDTETVFGEIHYVGHDEPSTLFYSNKPGSGNKMQYQLTLPKDPKGTSVTPGKSWNFQLHIAFWFGMAMCDTQSYPEQLTTCKPDSDSNIVDPAKSPNHPGTAFMELQFYPPGWTSWPAGVSCGAKSWCAALNIDSLSQDPVHGTQLNNTCQAITGIEPVNFAFLTKDGKAQAPANPVQSTLTTFTPDPKKDLFMNSGDQLSVTLHDTAHGLRTVVTDKTTGATGSMTSSAANGFGQVKYAPAPSTECTNIPYDFHPMYSTSSEQTRVIWAAHSYNIAFADEIGHFDNCTGTVNSNGTCTGQEGATNDLEATDGDDAGCFPASASLRIKLAGCIATNTGFDGTSYQKVWPDGSKLHPTPIQFSSPLTGDHYNQNYSRAALEADLPRIETNTTQACNRTTGQNCTLIPITDDNQPANFYPFFSITDDLNGDATSLHSNEVCKWLIGNDVPGLTRTDFGKNKQYGPLLSLTYLGPGGVPFQRLNNFRQIFSTNPCKAE
jgi:hypothetical protein